MFSSLKTQKQTALAKWRSTSSQVCGEKQACPKPPISPWERRALLLSPGPCSTAMKKKKTKQFKYLLQPFILRDPCNSSPPHYPLSKEYPPGPDTAPHICKAHTDCEALLGQQPCAAFLCLERPLRKYWPQPYFSLIVSGTESETCWKRVANRAEHTSILRRGRGTDTRTPSWLGTGLSSVGDCRTGGPHRTPTRVCISKPAGTISSRSNFWQQEVLCGLLTRPASPGACGHYSSHGRQMVLKAETVPSPCTSLLRWWWRCSGTCGQSVGCRPDHCPAKGGQSR